MNTIPRLLKPPDRSFFLFGPRGVGKSTWLRHHFSEAAFFDLLGGSLVLELSRHPSALEAMCGDLPEGAWVVLDEIQKLPQLLDEVHRLIELKRWRFVLCGSSARKIQREGVDLLAGRAVTRYLETFSYGELGPDFSLERALEWGGLPMVFQDTANAADILDAYVNTYINEEIKQEGAVRGLAPFLRFLSVAGICNGQLLNKQSIARDAGVPRSTVDLYFSIMTETLMGHFLHAYRPSVKVKEQTHPKFYWFDPGAARAAAGLLYDPLDRTWLGVSLETLIYHELRVYNHTQRKKRGIFFYRTPPSSEIDFIVETRKKTTEVPAHVVCIEVKLSDRWDRRWEKPMRSLSESGKIHVDKMVGVYCGSRSYQFGEVQILPVLEFLENLHDGSIF